MVDIGKNFLELSRIKLGDQLGQRADNLSKRLGHAGSQEKVHNHSKLQEIREPTRAAAEVDKAARDFEALLLHQMVKSMWRTVPSNGMLSGSKEEELYRDMLNEALATSISEGQGIGIRDLVVKEMEKRESSD